MKALIDRKLSEWERALRSSIGNDITTPANRRRALLDFHFFDHGFLRTVWTNFDRVAPDVYRSNQPDPARYRRLADRGIRTILNLRGVSPHSHYLFAEEACREHGLTMVSVPLEARRAVPRERVLELLRAFRTVEKPFLMHCKSGADRAGFASTLYLVAIRGESVEDAMRHLSLRYVHLKRSKTGICDHFFEVYAARNARAPIDIETWIATEYDADDLMDSFAAKRRLAA